jgi:hypothetical protein
VYERVVVVRVHVQGQEPAPFGRRDAAPRVADHWSAFTARLQRLRLQPGAGDVEEANEVAGLVEVLDEEKSLTVGGDRFDLEAAAERGRTLDAPAGGIDDRNSRRTGPGSAGEGEPATGRRQRDGRPATGHPTCIHERAALQRKPDERGALARRRRRDVPAAVC